MVSLLCMVGKWQKKERKLNILQQQNFPPTVVIMAKIVGFSEFYARKCIIFLYFILFQVSTEKLQLFEKKGKNTITVIFI